MLVPKLLPAYETPMESEKSTLTIWTGIGSPMKDSTFATASSSMSMTLGFLSSPDPDYVEFHCSGVGEFDLSALQGDHPWG